MYKNMLLQVVSIEYWCVCRVRYELGFTHGTQRTGGIAYARCMRTIPCHTIISPSLSLLDYMYVREAVVRVVASRSYVSQLLTCWAVKTCWWAAPQGHHHTNLLTSPSVYQDYFIHSLIFYPHRQMRNNSVGTEATPATKVSDMWLCIKIYMLAITVSKGNVGIFFCCCLQNSFPSNYSNHRKLHGQANCNPPRRGSNDVSEQMPHQDIPGEKGSQLKIGITPQTALGTYKRPDTTCWSRTGGFACIHIKNFNRQSSITKFILENVWLDLGQDWKGRDDKIDQVFKNWILLRYIACYANLGSALSTRICLQEEKKQARCQRSWKATSNPISTPPKQTPLPGTSSIFPRQHYIIQCFARCGRIIFTKSHKFKGKNGVGFVFHLFSKYHNVF